MQLILVKGPPQKVTVMPVLKANLRKNKWPNLQIGKSTSGKKEKWVKFSCLGHVVNLQNVDVMKHITKKIVVVENATAIWEYDPSQDVNYVLGVLLQPFELLLLKYVKKFVVFHFKISHFIIRSRNLDNTLRNSRTLRFYADFWRHWRFHFTVIFSGELP